MQYSTSRQDVTGLVVNTKVNTRTEYRRTVRAMVHRLLKTGTFQTRKTGYDDKQNLIVSELEGTLDQLNGMLSFADAVDTYNRNKLPKPPTKTSSLGVVYREFLFYRNFYATPAPLIVCEGKTDNIYIKAAIRKLVDSYPRLAQKDTKGKTEYGKYVFAEQVVKKNSDNIDFEGFKPLLERIDAVIVTHNKSYTQAAAF